MDPLLIASGAISILKQVLPAIEKAVQAREIPVEEQQALHNKIDLLRAGNFDGPEWKLE